MGSTPTGGLFQILEAHRLNLNKPKKEFTTMAFEKQLQKEIERPEQLEQGNNKILLDFIAKHRYKKKQLLSQT